MGPSPFEENPTEFNGFAGNLLKPLERAKLQALRNAIGTNLGDCTPNRDAADQEAF